MKITLLFFLCLTSCTQFQQKTEDKGPLYKYKADISITANDQKYDGMAVLNLLASQTIKIVSKAKLDVLIVSTCQRFETYEKLDSSWFGGAGKEFKYNYTPTKNEFNEKCPIYFQAFDKSGLTAWAYVAFKTDEKLQATVECNGKTFLSTGFTLCQTKNGFEQSLTFTKAITHFKGGDRCNIEKVNDFNFKIIPVGGFCNATFSDGKDWHQITLLGFEQALIRGE